MAAEAEPADGVVEGQVCADGAEDRGVGTESFAGDPELGVGAGFMELGKGARRLG